MCADKKKATLESMAKAERTTKCSTAIVNDPIDNATEVTQLTDEGNGAKSFTKANGDKFIFSALGVSFVPSGRDAKEAVAVCNYLSVDGRYRDRDGNNWGRIVSWFDDDGKEHSLQISEADLATKPTEVLEALSSGGLYTLCNSSRGMPNRVVDYIRSYPSSDLKKSRSTRAFGWFDAGKTFVLPDLVIGGHANDEAVVFDGDENDKPQYSQKGTLKEWKESIGYLAQYSSRVGFFTCIGFASPLASLVNEQTGGFHLYGLSSSGKSTALRALCSVFAPSRSAEGSGGEMGTWRATDNGLEAVCQSHTDLPLICDELSQANDKKLNEVIMMIGNETSKKRMTKTAKARKLVSWRFLMASSGELTADDMVNRAGLKLDNGARVRLANIPVPDKGLGVFDSLAPNMKAKDMADKIRECSESKSYGTAGIAFLKAFIDEVKQSDLDEVVSRIKADVRNFVNEVVPDDDPMVSRVAKRFGLVAVAGSLAEKYEVLPWSEGTAKRFAVECFKAWRANFKSQADIDREFIEWFLAIPETKRARFDIIEASAESVRPVVDRSGYDDRLGYIVLKVGNNRVYYIPEALKVLFEKNGYDNRTALNTLRENGLLLGKDKGYYNKIPSRGLNGLKPNARFVCVECPKTVVEVIKLDNLTQVDDLFM